MAVDISPFIEPAKKVSARTGIPASIILGQIMLESGGSYSGGLSGLAASAKNLFGVKGAGSAGSVYMPTKEFENGKYVTVNAAFRKYNSYEESIEDHAALLSKPRYAKHLVNAKTVNDYAAGIKAGGYATDPNYVNKLLGVISSNNLSQYDSGSLQFTPITIPGKGAYIPDAPTGSTGNVGGAGAKWGDGGEMTNIVASSIRVVALVLVFILAVVFFLRAFPATSDFADKVNPLSDPGKKIKTIQKLAKKAPMPVAKVAASVGK